VSKEKDNKVIQTDDLTEIFKREITSNDSETPEEIPDFTTGEEDNSGEYNDSESDK
jgi:hypothetical protein